jgi:hypothetical protein
MAHKPIGQGYGLEIHRVTRITNMKWAAQLGKSISHPSRG